MCDDEIHPGKIGYDATVSRRFFNVAALAAGSLAGGAALAADVVEKNVDVKTPDGTADAALYYPAGAGSWPGVLIWTDIFGLRPAFRDMAKRLAAQGYVVLVHNPFYRVGRAPIPDPKLDFSKPEDRAKIMDPNNRKGMDAPGVDRDSLALIKFLDAQPQTNKRKGVGVQGYCMGGPLAFRTAAAAPERVRALGSFHGGGLVSSTLDSPHRLVPKMKVEAVIAIAQNDDARTPSDKDDLKAAFTSAKVPAQIEVFKADHGWCVPGGGTYSEGEAERAWAQLTALYKKTLA
jgi:carboxymethylenebutenolidase